MKQKLLLAFFIVLVRSNLYACSTGTLYSSTIYSGPGIGGPLVVTNGTSTCIHSDQLFKMYSSGGVFYQVNSTIATDYITVTDDNGFSIADGTQPLIFQTNTLTTVRIYIHSSNQCLYDNVCRGISVSRPAVVPSLNTYPSVTQITATTATSGGLITNNGSATPTQFGVCYSIAPNPTISNFTFLGTSTGSGYFTSNITGLSPNTTYYLKAFATSAAGTGYGSQVVFTTPPVGCYGSTQSPASTVYSSSTAGQTTIIGACQYAGTYAKVDFYPGNYTLTSSIATDYFTISDLNNVVITKGVQPLNFSITNGAVLRVHLLKDSVCGTQNTCRYVSFTRNTATSSPGLITTSVSAITFSSATAGGYVSNAGASAVTARGLCYSTSPNPTIAGSTIASGSGVGAFSVSLAGLNGATKYYIRAYATNSVGTNYGQEVSFTTVTAVLATVSTAAVTAITDSTAHSGGSAMAAGSSPVTAKGVCYATTSNPTIANSVITSGAGLGAFTSTLTGLLPGTTYHVRAFATSAVGTAYGIDRVFTTTAPILASITTAAVTSITDITASSGGDVTSIGGSAVSSRGICFASTPNPTLANSIVSGGSGAGTFTSNLIGLLPSTTYYVRAYATNNTGTAYGNEVVFTTNAPNAITELNEQLIYSCYPNPFNDALIIQLKPGTKALKMNIINTLGESVYSEVLYREQNALNLQALPKGIYFIAVEGQAGRKLYKN